jgi:arsenical-resistance protein 2
MQIHGNRTAPNGPSLSSISAVIFHCSSSKGRGPRCAAWYQDKLDEMNNNSSKAFVLTGGIDAWIQSFPDEVVKV